MNDILSLLHWLQMKSSSFFLLIFLISSLTISYRRLELIRCLVSILEWHKVIEISKSLNIQNAHC